MADVLSSIMNSNGYASVAFNNVDFNFGSLLGDAVTILHELGHVYQYLFGQNSTAIKDDQGNADLTKANSALVKSKCFPGVVF